MPYVPVYCVPCRRCSLAPATDGAQGLVCAFCEGPTLAVPGPAYGDGDWLAFAEIDRAVFESDLSAVDAASLASDLQAMLDAGAPFAQTMNAALGRFPGLVHARPALANQPARGLRMLVTALTARTRNDAKEAMRAS